MNSMMLAVYAVFNLKWITKFSMNQFAETMLYSTWKIFIPFFDVQAAIGHDDRSVDIILSMGLTSSDESDCDKSKETLLAASHTLPRLPDFT